MIQKKNRRIAAFPRAFVGNSLFSVRVLSVKNWFILQLLKCGNRTVKLVVGLMDW